MDTMPRKPAETLSFSWIEAAGIRSSVSEVIYKEIMIRDNATRLSTNNPPQPGRFVDQNAKARTTRQSLNEICVWT